jgi:hypothetical protein
MGGVYVDAGADMAAVEIKITLSAVKTDCVGVGNVIVCVEPLFATIVPLVVMPNVPAYMPTLSLTTPEEETVKLPNPPA